MLLSFGRPLALAVLLGLGFCAAQQVPAPHLASRPLPARSQAVLQQAMELFDQSYDAGAHLLLRPQDRATHARGKYMVRESSWYALALLMRHGTGDQARALEMLDAVLREQYTDPAAKWYGTFRRSPEEPLPGTGDPGFTSYDPNWRHFIGTILETILIEYDGQLPRPLAARMMHAIDLAVEGEMRDGRLVPSYSNIALMYGALWDFAAARDRNPDWQRRSAAWNDEVFRLYHQHDTFNEYNAPTYYGVDLYGLALWREFGSNAHLRMLGSTMEAGLWRSIAQFYQPALRNLCGPYDRSYGMDMTQYVTPTGVWMRTLLDAADAPLPEHPTLDTYQVADMWFAPQIVLLTTHIPADALTRLHTVPAPHPVEVTVDAQRRVTSWLGAHSMWGGEFTSRTKDSGGRTQFHPVTAHWLMPSGTVGWIRVTRSPEMDASADQTGLQMSTDGDVTIRLFGGPGLAAQEARHWKLPGIEVTVETDAADATAGPAPPDCPACQEITFHGVHTLRLRMTP